MKVTPHFQPRTDGIGHIVKDQRPTIPLHQRAYAWTEDEVTKLFDDLSAAIIAGAADYF